MCKKSIFTLHPLTIISYQIKLKQRSSPEQMNYLINANIRPARFRASITRLVFKRYNVMHLLPILLNTD